MVDIPCFWLCCIHYLQAKSADKIRDISVGKAVTGYKSVEIYLEVTGGRSWHKLSKASCHTMFDLPTWWSKLFRIGERLYTAHQHFLALDFRRSGRWAILLSV